MRLKELRQKLALSQKEVAKNVGISQNTLHYYETGRSEPSQDILIKLADYFHVSVDELLGRPTSIINKMSLTPRARSIIEKVIGMTDKQQELTEFYIDTMLGSM